MDRRRFIETIGATALGILIPQESAAQNIQVLIKAYMLHEVSPGQVARLAETDLRAGRKVITFGDLADIFEGTIPYDGKPLSIFSFDDRLESQKHAFSELNSFGAKGTFFVMAPGWPGDEIHNYLTDEEIGVFSESGHEMGSHTINHPNLLLLRSQNYPAYLAEIYESLQRIAELTRKKVVSFCPPNGSFDRILNEDLEKAYRISATIAPDQENPRISFSTSDRFNIGRIRLS